MKLIEIRRMIKKDPPGSLWIFLHRKIGLVLTWFFVNVLSFVKPNQVTLSMLFFNIISSLLVFYGILHDSVLLISLALIIFFLSHTLDCVDGNLARIYNLKSYKGIFYDRIVHNISHPLILFAIGFSIAYIHNSFIYAAITTFAALNIEFSPLEIARKDVKISFINQLILKRSQNFTLYDHLSNTTNVYENTESKQRKTHDFLVRIVKFIFSFETLFILLLVETFFNNYNYIVSITFITILGVLHFGKGFIGNDLKQFLNKLNELSKEKQ